MTVGRPREFRNAAEKQKAYRERQKAQQIEPIELDPVTLAVMENCKQGLVTLQNLVNMWQRKNKTVEIVQRQDYAVVLVDGYNQWTIFGANWIYIRESGVLVEKRKMYGDVVYQIKPISTNMSADN